MPRPRACGRLSGIDDVFIHSPNGSWPESSRVEKVASETIKFVLPLPRQCGGGGAETLFRKRAKGEAQFSEKP